MEVSGVYHVSVLASLSPLLLNSAHAREEITVPQKKLNRIDNTCSILPSLTLYKKLLPRFIGLYSISFDTSVWIDIFQSRFQLLPLLLLPTQCVLLCAKQIPKFALPFYDKIQKAFRGLQLYIASGANLGRQFTVIFDLQTAAKFQFKFPSFRKLQARYRGNQVVFHTLIETKTVPTFMGKYLFISWLKSWSVSSMGNNSVAFLFSSAHKRQRNESHNKIDDSILFQDQISSFPSNQRSRTPSDVTQI